MIKTIIIRNSFPATAIAANRDVKVNVNSGESERVNQSSNWLRNVPILSLLLRSLDTNDSTAQSYTPDPYTGMELP